LNGVSTLRLGRQRSSKQAQADACLSSTVSAEIKRTAVRRVAAGEDVSAVAATLGVDRQRICEWQEVARRGGLEALRGPGRPRRIALDGPPLTSAILNDGAAARRRIAELERMIGQQPADRNVGNVGNSRWADGSSTDPAKHHRPVASPNPGSGRLGAQKFRAPDFQLVEMLD
jgi:hypothetical protein